MRRFGYLLLAAASALAAAERPRYGGALRVAMHAAPRTLDPAAEGADARISSAVFDTLTRLDERGRVQPSLAASWQSEQGGRRWHFRLRHGVRFHDGSALTPAAAAGALPEWGVSAVADGIAIQLDKAAPELPAQLAAPRYSIALRGPDGSISGTGPFRIAQFEPGERALLAANGDYWDGRPFLDEVRIEMGRTPHQQALDLEVGTANLVEVSPNELRRAAQARTRLWSSAPLVLIALAFDRVDDARLREAVALAIDRTAIHAVLFQKQGEIAGGVLPQWISGYAFLFPTARDTARARELAPANPPALVIAHDPGDPLARMVAERVAVNARDAGLRLVVSPQPARADLRVVRQRVRPYEVAEGASPEARYAAERALIEEYRFVPLVHLRETYASTQAVRTWHTPGLLRTGRWRFDDLWLRPEQP